MKIRICLLLPFLSQYSLAATNYCVSKVSEEVCLENVERNYVAQATCQKTFVFLTDSGQFFSRTYSATVRTGVGTAGILENTAQKLASIELGGFRHARAKAKAGELASEKLKFNLQAIELIPHCAK